MNAEQRAKLRAAIEECEEEAYPALVVELLDTLDERDREVKRLRELLGEIRLLSRESWRDDPRRVLYEIERLTDKSSEKEGVADE